MAVMIIVNKRGRNQLKLGEPGMPNNIRVNFIGDQCSLVASSISISEEL